MAWDRKLTAGVPGAALLGAALLLAACASPPETPGAAVAVPGRPVVVAGTLAPVASLPALMADARKQMALRAPRAALNYLDTAVRLSANDQSPQRAEVLSLRAEALLATGQAGRALADVEMAIAMRSDIAPYHVLRAAALFDLKRPTDAVGALDRAITLTPDEAPYYLFRAVIQLVVGNMHAALADLDAYGARQGGLRDAFQRGLVQHLDRNFDGAIREYDAALAQEPPDQLPGSRAAVTRLMRGFAYHQTGHYEAAVRDYGAVLALQPGPAWDFVRVQRDRARNRIPLEPVVEA